MTLIEMMSRYINMMITTVQQKVIFTWKFRLSSCYCVICGSLCSSVVVEEFHDTSTQFVLKLDTLQLDTLQLDTH